jgi:lysophospholipase L1-like esterase
MSKRLRRRTSRRLKIAGLALGGVVAVGLAVGVASAAIVPAPAPVADKVQDYYDKSVASAKATTAAPVVKAVSFAAYGDSISEGNSPSFVDGKFGSLSWPKYVGTGFTFAGGWAKGGVQTDEMLAHAKPVKADVLVLLAGANDYAHDVPFEVTTANLDGIVKATGIKRVVVSAVPPSDLRPADAIAFNESLKDLAAERRWEFIDPMGPLRNGNNYAAGMTRDGVHPTEKAAKLIGEGIAAALKV